MMGRYLTAATATLLLAACASSGEVTQLDRDTYMLTASSPWRGNEGVAVEGVRRADAYCKNLGRRMRVVGSERADGVPVVLPPKALLTFRCDPAG
ncbi:hypothetical protein Herbaro_21795 [Herbaspirillum sp. WKF16]|uniref:hypothetical protein n=1 Tax=Herbaspirillum sp. WKF16 TaxID=3028312 RepID=UPI0023A9B493|nr:hypothetical protein [Herbaspirillum sp. WKF16]WDZ96078.1 hypothetical protein Herbaro_21795 [Herbaspirillum sp. WKF16]